MTELMVHLPLLVLGVALLVAAAVGWGVYNVLWSRRNRYAASGFTEAGELRDTIDRLKQEQAFRETALARLREELAGMVGKRDQLEKLHAELTDAEQRLLASRDALEQAYRAKAELATAQEEMERVRAEKTALAGELEALEARKAETAETARRFEEQFQAAKAQVEQATTSLATLQAQAMAAQSELKGAQSQIDALRSHEAEARKAAEEADRRSGEARRRQEELEAELRRLEAEKSRLDKVEPALVAGEEKVRAAERELARLEKDVERSKDELEAVRKTLAGHEEERRKAEETRREVAELREEKERLADRRADEELAFQKVAAEVLRLKGELGDSGRKEPARDLKEPPQVVLGSAPEPRPCRDGEQDLLSEFLGALEEAGLVFSRRTVYSFHTALKCQDINPLTVLAGVSGTGKTLLPIQYATYLGLMQLVISVQPRWDSPQDLFGFYNYLEREYKATDLSRLLWSYGNRPELGDRMSIVLFDEMNLARTEYYFSDFLSKLELRRLRSPNADIQIDIPNDRQLLPVPRNMLMVGTMNEDESTQTLSDKVLDRANVLRFGRPASGGRERPGRTNTVGFCGQTVTKSVWDRWLADGTLSGSAEQKVSEWIRELNDALEMLGRPFGYRVQEAMKEYVRQYPDRGQKGFRNAFADQIEQKILPKIRGVDTNAGVYDRAMGRIRGVIDETGDAALHEAFVRADREAQAQGIFVWGGVSRTEDRKTN